MKRCMVDIESLGLEPGAVILSIGAVHFDENGIYEDDEFYANIDLKSSMERGLQVEPDTLEWWLGQDEEAQTCLTDGVPIFEALLDFKDFYDAEEIWANSPAMDCSLLEAAYDSINVQEPWEYHEERDHRTLEAIPGVTEPLIEDEGVKHNALDDAKVQAQKASKMLSQLEA